VFVERFNYLVERLLIAAICLWGSWAIYYWAAILIFDASYSSIKAYVPVLLLQVLASLYFLRRLDLGLSSPTSRMCSSEDSAPRTDLDTAFYKSAVAATILVTVAVVAASHFQLSESSLAYNLLWALLLPFSLAYVFNARASVSNSSRPPAFQSSTLQVWDCLIFIVGAMAFSFSVQGIGFPTPDDAFYGHVMSSTLANPELPVQGKDFLLNTQAPYSLHPAYRMVGYEVFITLVSDLVGIGYLHAYFDWMRVFGSLLWSIAAYAFMRVIRTPFPGVAVTICSVVLLFWSGADSPVFDKVLMVHWGKTLVGLVGSPLLFVSVAVFIRKPCLRTWSILLLSVCTIAIWSSTALLFIPLCVGMACMVFLQSPRSNLLAMSGVIVSLMPVVITGGYSALVLNRAPVYTGGYGTGVLSVAGEAFGGLYLQCAFLVMLLILPTVARSSGDAYFQRTMLRISMVGFFTVMAPFFIEAIARLTGLYFLSQRLPTAFPLLLVMGVGASTTLALLSKILTGGIDTPGRFRALVLAFGGYATLIALMPLEYFSTYKLKLAAAIQDVELKEATDARKLIANDSYVLAGYLEEILPLLPEPPSFVQVRHYLTYHRFFLSDSEFSDRQYLYTAIKNLSLAEGEELAATLNSMTAKAEALGVTTFVFQAYAVEADPGKARFAAALTARLEQLGYNCATTPSGRTTVCNRP